VGSIRQNIAPGAHRTGGAHLYVAISMAQESDGAGIVEAATARSIIARISKRP